MHVEPCKCCVYSSSEDLFVSEDRVGFSKKGADLQGSLGNLWGSPGDFRGSLGNFRETSALLSNSTVRELPGKSPGTSGDVRGTSGEVRGLFRSSGEPDSLPATCLNLCPQRVPDRHPPTWPFRWQSPGSSQSETWRLFCEGLLLVSKSLSFRQLFVVLAVRLHHLLPAPCGPGPGGIHQCGLQLRNEQSAQRGTLGQTSMRTSGQKLRSGHPHPGNRCTLARTSRADVHEKN